MSELAPPQLSSMLREELRKLLQAGVYSAKDISDAISPSALSRFLNGADDETGLRINTLERILQKINGYIQVVFSSAGQVPVHFTTRPISEKDRSALHQSVCMALFAGPAAIYGRNGLCYAVNDELRRLLGLESAARFFDDDSPLHKDLKAHQQFLQHALRRIGDPGNASPSGSDEPAPADSQTPLRIFEVAYGENSDRSMFVGEVARLLDCPLTDAIRREFGGELLVVSCSDATDIQLRLEELDTLWKLINDPFSQINVHVVEPTQNPQSTEQADYSKVTFISSSARALLQIDKNARDIRLKDFVCANTDKLKERMAGKFERGDLTVSRSRTFHLFRREGIVLPVAIHDYGVAEVRPNTPCVSSSTPQRRRFSKILTLWRKTQIPEDIFKILEIYGARNPALAQAQIQSVVKLPVAPRPGNRGLTETSGEKFTTTRSDYRLIYMNPLFRSKHEPRLRDLTKRTDHDKSHSNEIENFPLESEIFNKPGDQSLQTEYHRIDERVLQRAQDTGEASVERIEKHRYRDSENESDDEDNLVHVVKIAVKERIGPDGAECWVLHIFFWPADRQKEEQVFAALRAQYSAWRILDSLPLPVYAKDSTLSLLYANKAYVDDLKQVTATDRSGVPDRIIARQRDIVGHRDGDFFTTEQALKFESDDRRLLSGNIEVPYHCVEAHGNNSVQVWKKAISFPTHRNEAGSDDARGIIGIYCTVGGDIPAPDESSPQRPRRGRPPAMKLPRKNRLTPSQNDESLQPEQSTETCLEENEPGAHPENNS
ncbi:MAG: hypothetical protein ACKO3T_01075 [Planctomycetaceae bacterium]